MRIPARRTLALLTIVVLMVLCVPTVANARHVPAPQLSAACSALDVTSARSLFECMGTLRHRNGQSKFANPNAEACATIVRMLFREMGRISEFRNEATPLPSCQVVAQAYEMMRGKPPYWSACTGYPNPDPDTHMRKCMPTFATAYYGTRGARATATCETFRRAYETALKRANNRDGQRLPAGYAPPPCASVNEVIVSLTGAESQWSGCANYDPAKVRDHLLACVGAEPREFLQWRNCAAVRMVYEQRLKATHGGLPPNYAILACDDAQVVLDKAVAYRENQDVQRRARADAAEQARVAAAERQQERVRAAREAILAQRKNRPATTLRACESGQNKYPEHEYGEILTALEVSCRPAPSNKALLFMAGLGEQILKNCARVPANSADRTAIARFIAASVQVGVGGSQYNNPDLGIMMRDQAGSQAAYLAGAATFRGLDGCADPGASTFANGLARYLKESAAASAWVDGCELYYATRYSRGQCQCMAESLRAVAPAIHDSQFSRASIKGMIDRAPLQGLQMAVTCKVSDY